MRAGWVRRGSVGAIAVAVFAGAACSSGGGGTDRSSGSLTPQPAVDLTIPAVGTEYSDPCPAPPAATASGVTLTLQRTFEPGAVLSFGVPLPHGAVADVSAIQVRARGEAVDAQLRPLLSDFDDAGSLAGVRSVLVQVPSSVLDGDCGSVEVTWDGSPGSTPANDVVPYDAVSAPSDEVVVRADRTIEEHDGAAEIVEIARDQRVLFSAREPAALARFPDGYLAATGLFGRQVSAAAIGSEFDGLRFLSEQAAPFGLSLMYQEDYALNPNSVVGPEDIDEDAGVEGFEAWLYDRCTTFLLFAVHTGDTRFLREGYRSCFYYASRIELSGENRGIFTLKPERDTKYSHLRGLYLYYALTGDESALEAGEAIADLWLSDEEFSVPYRDGHLRSPDALWTERLLGTSLEGLLYGHLLTGQAKFRAAAEELVTTAYSHITGDAGVLAALNPGATQFPPQDCFIHTAEQAAEGDATDPFCSGWMPAVVLVEPLLRYQELTGDERVDEIFIRLARFLRDTATTYFQDGPLEDHFLDPSVAYDPAVELESQRLVVPAYGSGIDGNGERQFFGEYDDFLHCADATILTAAALRSLARTGGMTSNPIGPFANEGESFVALHQEFAYCAYFAFVDQTRPHRDPTTFDSEELQEGLDDPATFIEENRIGYPSHNIEPQRKISWWFNASLEQFALLADAGVTVPELHPGTIQP